MLKIYIYSLKDHWKTWKEKKNGGEEERKELITISNLAQMMSKFFTKLINNIKI